MIVNTYKSVRMLLIVITILMLEIFLILLIILKSLIYIMKMTKNKRRINNIINLMIKNGEK